MVLFIQLDAIRHDYINLYKPPFLSQLFNKSLSGKLKPTFGFEPDFAFLAGLYPDEANGGAQFIKAIKQSPFESARFIPKICNNLPHTPKKVIRKILKTLLNFKMPSPFVTTASIPFQLLPFFDLAVNRALDWPNLWPEPSVFDYLRDNNKSWLLHSAPNYKVEIQSAVTRAQQEIKPPISFAYFHIGNLDQIGHAFGPNSTQMQTEVEKVDRGIKKICDIAKSRFSNVSIIIIGDHGMADVEHYIDVNSRLESLAFKNGRDYLMLIDSTMVRFWFFNPKARVPIKEILMDIKGGHIITQNERNEFHLNYSDNRFGDVMFVADGGTLILPNYYQGDVGVKGMHGYLPDYLDQQSLFIINSPLIERPDTFNTAVDMRNIFPTLLYLLDFPIRYTSRDLKSLI